MNLELWTTTVKTKVKCQQLPLILYAMRKRVAGKKEPCEKEFY